MRLSRYFFFQFIPPFFFGAVLFLFVLLLDRLFDIIDLIFNKGVNWIIVARLFALFVPTVIPLTLPMASLLACLVTFGRLSEENELSAVRSAGISLFRVLWLPPLFTLILSLGMIPFNTHIAPWANRGFRLIYEQIANADPLINIQEKKFFAIRNIKLFPEEVNKDTQQLINLFVFQSNEEGRPPERIFAKTGVLRIEPNVYQLDLSNGQLEKYDAFSPPRILHTAFDTYRITIPAREELTGQNTRFRNLSSPQLNELQKDLKSKGMPVHPVNAERSLRIAIAFSPLALALVGIPLATVLRRGGKGFGFGVSIVVIFIYYTLLILGLTLAEKGILPSDLALWIGNGTCFILAVILIARLAKQ
ncbi:MAG: hypothetical protein KCHDKBKB_00487 [Elusimicrobia bacterium]|nr:hypothetical protein [Elusimicrobiota bacterium]